MWVLYRLFPTRLGKCEHVLEQLASRYGSEHIGHHVQLSVAVRWWAFKKNRQNTPSLLDQRLVQRFETVRLRWASPDCLDSKAGVAGSFDGECEAHWIDHASEEEAMNYQWRSSASCLGVNLGQSRQDDQQQVSQACLSLTWKWVWKALIYSQHNVFNDFQGHLHGKTIPSRVFTTWWIFPRSSKLLLKFSRQEMSHIQRNAQMIDGIFRSSGASTGRNALRRATRRESGSAMA